MGIRNKWVVKTSEPVLQRIFARKLGISPLLAQLLANRGIYTIKAAREFLDASLQDLHSPRLMLGMPKAVEVIEQALARGQRLLVYGDYDVDGVTGTAFLVDILRRLGGTVDYYIPNRVTEGYGLNAPALARARESGVDLIITVDCGISAVSEVEEAQSNGGPEIIITDHHEPPEVLPGATAIVNPKQVGCAYPFKELAGVGVAFKLGQALLEKLGHPFSCTEYLDLVSLGTVADIVSLKGENRILVKHGLVQLNQSNRPGLQALCRVGGVKQGDLGTREVSFILAPRLNAAGRIGDAAAAVELLLARDAETAATLATELNKKNQERQKMEADTMAEALVMLKESPELAAMDVLVLSSLHWHPGVIGIVASRLVDRFNKPVLLISSADDPGQGSARSVPGFNLYHSLEYCSKILEGYGGHALAAGFSVSITKIEQLRRKINQYAAINFPEGKKIPVLELDALVSLQDVTPELVDEIKQLAPYGQENPNPLLGLQRAKLIHCREVGNKKAHLKMLLGDRRLRIDGIGFNLGHYAQELDAGHEVNVAFAPTINKWQGKELLQIKVKDLQKDTVKLTQCASDMFPGEEELTAVGDLILVPETIIHLLHHLLLTGGHAIAPEIKAMALVTKSIPNSQLLSDGCPTGHSASLISQLASLNWDQEKILLLVNSTGHVVQLSRHINKYNDCHKDGLTCVHSFMQPELVQKTIAQYARASAGLLVTTFNCLSCLKGVNIDPDRVILAKPPVFESDWQLVPKKTVNGTEPRALYATKAWESNRKHLEEFAPTRAMLTMYYSLLRTRASQGIYSKTRLLEQMRQQGFSLSSWLSLAVAVAVFAELDLLQYHWQQDMLIYKLLPAQGRKRDLFDSSTFVEVHKQKKKGLDWINKSMKVNGT